MNVSIIIVNYNTKELLENCLESIFEHTLGINFEIIVVDNASIDGSQMMVIQNFPTVKLIELNENIGFARANNEGVKIASGKYLFFLNSDTIILNNAIFLFFNFMENLDNTAKIGAIGALLLDKKKQIIHSFGHLPNLYNDIVSDLKANIVNLIGRERYFKLKLQSKQLLHKKGKNYFSNNTFFEVGYITGADLFISKKLFIQLNGFDSNYFMYYEESDLQYRMRNKGFKSAIIKGPEIQHLEGASFKKEKTKRTNNRRFYLNTSHFHYYKKNHSPLIYYSYRLIFTLIQLVTIFDTTYSFKDRLKYIKFITK